MERWLSAGAEPSAACEGHDNWASLHYASQRGDVPVSEALIRHGAQIEAVTSRGRGCLHLAAQEGGEKHIAVMDLLLSSGANANLQTPVRAKSCSVSLCLSSRHAAKPFLTRAAARCTVGRHAAA